MEEKSFICHYQHNGKTYSLTITAYSWEDAEHALIDLTNTVEIMGEAGPPPVDENQPLWYDQEHQVTDFLHGKN